jgi:hypothetical protein
VIVVCVCVGQDCFCVWELIVVCVGVDCGVCGRKIGVLCLGRKILCEERVVC